jgi:hypothetical protein
MKKELSAGTKDKQQTTADNSTSASLEQNGMLCAVSTGKYDKNGIEIFVGSVIKRIYTYEIRLKNNIPYAHILDGTNYHLKLKDIEHGFNVVSFSKQVATKLMKKGKRVTHRYFSNDEWITMIGNIIRMELGQECWASEFWRDRTDKAWETDWYLYGA